MSLLSPLFAIAGICGSLYYIFAFPAKGFTGYFDEASLVFLAVMPPSIMLLSHTLVDFFLGILTLIKSLFHNNNKYMLAVNDTLTKASALVRSEGIGALVKVRQQIKYDFLRDGVSLIVNDFSPDEIRHNLTNKLNARQARMALAANLFENMAKVSPGVGMIGTLIGLIKMMGDMKDPSNIGAGMALAMITTLYGLLLGTILYAPMSEKISLEAEKMHELDLMVLEGVLGLKHKKSSIHMKDIMNTFSGGRKGKEAAPKTRGKNSS